MRERSDGQAFHSRGLSGGPRDHFLGKPGNQGGRFMATVLSLLLLGGALELGGQSPSPRWNSPVITQADLLDALGDPALVIIHLGTEERYQAGHVPGARFARLQQFQAPAPAVVDGVPDGLSVELPDPEALQAVLRELGVREDSRVVLYLDDGREPQLTRILHTMTWAGLSDRTAIMLGGTEGWSTAGGSLAVALPSEVEAGDVVVRPDPSVMVSAEEVLALGRTPGVRILDARAEEFFAGEREDRGRAGHIPGAANLPQRFLFQSDRTFLELDELRALFTEAGVEPGDRIVAYCHVGLFGTTLVAAARLLGHEVVLYDGSWEEWARTDYPATIP